MTAQEENLSRPEKIKKRLKELWRLLEPYRLGFGLGILAVSATILIVLTGQKSEKLNYSVKPKTRNAVELIAVLKESGNSVSPVLGVQDVATKTAVSTQTSRTSPKPVPTGKVNINTASLAELISLPGIGETIAKSIIEYRNTHGPFKSINELDNVKRISLKTIEKIKNLITLE